MCHMIYYHFQMIIMRKKIKPWILEENGNLLDSQRFNSQETMFIPHILTSEEISIAPDEVKNIFNDNHNI